MRQTKGPKGAPSAIEALKGVRGKLLVIGTGPLEAQLKRTAESLGVGARVIWHGSASPDELAGAYRAATALWFPSTARSEGFGVVQVEAMAAGCPVINTAIDGSGVPWVCRHEREGLTAPVGDAAAFAALANRMLEPGVRERSAMAGRERAATEFDHRLMAERTLAIYPSGRGNGSEPSCGNRGSERSSRTVSGRTRSSAPL